MSVSCGLVFCLFRGRKNEVIRLCVLLGSLVWDGGSGGRPKVPEILSAGRGSPVVPPVVNCCVMNVVINDCRDVCRALRFRAEEMTGKHVELDLGLNKSHIFLVLSFYVVLLLHVLFSPFSAHVLAGITVYQTQKCFTQLSYLGTVNGKRQSQKRDKRLDTRPYVSIQRKFRYFYSHAIARAHGTPWGCINTYCVPC